MIARTTSAPFISAADPHPVTRGGTCVAPVASFSGLATSAPDAYAAYQRKYKAIHVIRDNRDLRRRFEGRVLDVGGLISRRILRPIKAVLKRLRPPVPVHTDKGTVAGVDRVLVDFRRQDDPRRAEVLRQEGEPPLRDKRADFLFEEAGIGMKRANELIASTIAELIRLYPEVRNLPIAPLAGRYLLGLNFDPEPKDEYGWPNAAAIAADNAAGTMLTGALTAFEEKFFSDPALARSVIRHEAGHLVQGRLYPWLAAVDVSGAIGEAFADLYSLWVTNEEEFGGKPMPKDDRARWGLGDDFVKQSSRHSQAQFLRHFFGEAHDDGHEVLGDCLDDHKWPIKTEGEFEPEYVDRRVQDNGGVHLNASAINLLHYTITMEAFEGDIRKCMEMASLAIAIAAVAGDPGIVLHDLAVYEAIAARHLYGEKAATRILQLWRLNFRLKLPDDVTSVSLPRPDFDKALAGFRATRPGTRRTEFLGRLLGGRFAWLNTEP